MSGWQFSPLLEVCRAYQPQTIGRKDMDDDGAFPVYGANGVIGRYHSFNHEESEVLLGCRGSCGSVNVSEPQSWVTGNAMVIKPRDHRLSKEFLRYFLDGSDAIAKTITGVAQPQITQKSLASVVIPLPPLEEQRRIVAVLDEAFAAIATATANAETNIANARELSAMFPASDSGNNTRIAIGELLERGWLKGHMDGNHGGDYPRKDEFVNAGVTYLSANCIRDGLVDLRRAKFLTKERARKLRKGFAKSRDVLFAHNATVGPAALLQTAEDFVVLGTSLTYYRCDEDVIMPEYLVSYLRSPAFVEQYTAVMRQSTRNQVPITKQREFYVDLPPIAEQRRLMASLASFQEDGRALAKIYRAKLEAMDVLKKSLLHRAFTGELTAAMPETIAA